MKPVVASRETCRLCGSVRLELALRLEPTPLGDEFVPEGDCSRTQPCYPLELVLCGDCAHVQLQHVVDPDVIYPRYTYTSSVSLGLNEHFLRYAEATVQRLAPPPGALVVEMGSNEGSLLRAFQHHGLQVLGVDPAREIAHRATAAGIETWPEYFTADVARQLRRQRGLAALVVANYVLANIDDLSEVMAGIRTVLAPAGVFLFETSYCLDVVEQNLIDTVFHEHLSYFALRPLARFFRREGLELIDAERVATKGGSLRLTVQWAGGPRATSPRLTELLDRETQAGLDSVVPFRALAARLENRKTELRNRLRPWRDEGRTFAGYGAAVGLTTMIYHFGLGAYLRFLADDNPGKQGLFSPGLHLPTLASESLYERQPDFVVVLAWRFVDAIARRHRKYLDQGGRFILPLPEVRVFEGRDTGAPPRNAP